MILLLAEKKKARRKVETSGRTQAKSSMGGPLNEHRAIFWWEGEALSLLECRRKKYFWVEANFCDCKGSVSGAEEAFVFLNGATSRNCGSRISGL
jgi:hypothetical protein